MRWLNPPTWTCPVHGTVLDTDASKVNDKVLCMRCLRDYESKQRTALALKVCKELTMLTPAYR